MVRVEHDPEQSRDKALRESIRKEVRDELKAGMRKRRRLGCLGGLLIFLVIIAVLAAGIAFLISQTGAIRLPVFSRLYRPPEPARIITPEILDASIFLENAGPTLKLTEEEATGLLSQGIGKFGGQGFRPRTAQIAFEDGYAELYLDLDLERLHARLLVSLEPVLVEDGILKIAAREVHLGAIPLHPAIVNILVDGLLNPRLSEVMVSLKSIGTIDSITVKPGLIEFVLRS